MSSVDSSPIDVRRFQGSASIMQSIKKKAIASFHNSTTSEDQPLDFSTKKTATPCQDSGLRQTTDIRSPAIADHPMQSVRHDSPEESILNNMQFRASPSSSPDSLSPSPPMSQLQQLPPSPVPSTTGASSPNGLVTNGMSGRLEEMSLPSHAQRYVAPFVYPVPTALLTPSPQYLTVDTTQGVNGVNHSSPVALDSKLMHYQRMYPHFAPMNGHVSPEYLNGINGDSSVSSLIIPAEKKGTKATRPFNIYPNNSLLPNIPDMFSYPIGSAMRDQELRFAQYTEQCILPKRRVANGQVKNGESKPTTADKNSKGEEPMQTDSNSNSSDGSPAVNGNGQAAVTSTGPSTSEQIPKRKNRALPEELKDEAYWERRRKNNEAAKRSRDARRAKEDEIAMRCSFLQSENMKLRAENETLRLHLASLTARIGR